ncbi:MAG TPA: carbamoyltransferase HypF [Desulfobacterales bacterium]|nr:carbamoyltransferase HypF [Desulfobacterales bacterium]HIP39916.1 carbamoyltransferase HypF [Desulfocapsa sulfexigens]
MPISKNKQLKITIKGIVQGVGFRPHVYSCATRLGLSGSVANNAQGVVVLIAGSSKDLEEFIDFVKKTPPPLSHIIDITIEDSSIEIPSNDFTIVDSEDGEVTTLMAPDVAVCSDCLQDIFSPNNRRFHYPFTNCTNCGPRLTIIQKLPYDRQHTSMFSFPMCKACEQEYNDPENRRFHAQPNACSVCGPELSWIDCNGKNFAYNNDECLFRCAEALKDGKIVAIKGVGGFHLAVNAASNEAVQRLRFKKKRPAKPFAIMVPTSIVAQKYGVFNDEERKLLLSRNSPIVLVRKQANIGVLSQYVAPGLCELGIMVPHTPLHHLLFAMPDCPDQLVMTSGNLTAEPLCIDNDSALNKLAKIADCFLLHNRDIVTRADDSVVRVIQNKLQIIRRSRGYVPIPISVPQIDKPIMACGAELKNCFSLSRDGLIFQSQHIGDLKGPANMVFFEKSMSKLQDVLELRPKYVACDLHPDYLSSSYADASGLPCVKVQHHHAHAAAIMAENDIDEGLAVIFDGTGLGQDKTIWGGEFLYVKGADYERLGSLAPLYLPGGDRASLEIWRMGLALLSGSGIDILDSSELPESFRDIPKKSLLGIHQIMETGINTPQTSSIGRLFDGVASLLGLRKEVDFEGQAAMELETLAWEAYEGDPSIEITSRYNATIKMSGERLLLDYRPLVIWLLEDLHRGVSNAEIAFFFHLWLVRSTNKLLLYILARFQTTDNILLGGGCFQNKMLLSFLVCRLKENGLIVFSNEQVPVNDGGIALGQLYIANKRITEDI